MRCHDKGPECAELERVVIKQAFARTYILMHPETFINVIFDDYFIISLIH